MAVANTKIPRLIVTRPNQTSHRYDQISTTKADRTGGKEVIEFDAEVESGLSGWPSQIQIARNAVDFSTISTIDMAEEEENSPDLDITPDENLDSTLICTSNSSSPRDIFYTPRTEITPMILRRKVLAETSTKLIGSIDEREHLVDERNQAISQLADAEDKIETLKRFLEQELLEKKRLLQESEQMMSKLIEGGQKVKNLEPTRQQHRGLSDENKAINMVSVAGKQRLNQGKSRSQDMQHKSFTGAHLCGGLIESIRKSLTKSIQAMKKLSLETNLEFENSVTVEVKEINGNTNEPVTKKNMIKRRSNYFRPTSASLQRERCIKLQLNTKK